MKKVRILIGGALGDVPHYPGDIIEAPTSRKAAEWIAAGIAEPAPKPAWMGGED